MKYKDIAPSRIVEEGIELVALYSEDGDRILPQRKLADKYSVSRNAINLALAKLEKNGILRQQRNRGMVINKKIDINLLAMSPMSEELKRLNIDITHIESKYCKTPNELTDFFGKESKNLVVIRRKRRYQEKVISYEEAYLDKEKFGDLVQIDFNNRSLYEVLKSKYNLAPTYGRENISCVLADRLLSDELNIEFGKPVYKVDSFNYGEDDFPIEHTTQYLPAHNIKYHFQAKNILDYREDE